MAELSSTNIYGDLTVNNNVDVKGAISENGFLISDKYASLNHNHTIDNLNNVTITNNINGQILVWNGTKWVNNSITSILGYTPPNIIRGSSNFVGYNDATGYRQINLGITMPNTNYTVYITPTAVTNGTLGEYHVIKSTTYIRVYNTGSFTGGFDYTVLY